MNTYDDWGDVEAPRQISLDEQRQVGLARRNTYVSPVAPGTTSRAYPMEATSGDPAIIDLGRALDAQDLHENTTPLNRSIAFAVRVALLVALLGALAFGLCLLLLFGDSMGWPILIMAGLAIGGYYYLNQLDYAHSPAGVEKDKIEAIRDVALDKQRGERALRREVIRGYLRTIVGGQDDV